MIIQSFIRFSLQQKIFFNLIFILLTVSGFFAVFSMPVERFPNVNFGEVTITTYYPGASPTEIETLITRKLEEAVETVEHIEWISSTSYPERSYIRLKFIDDSDYAFLYNEVRLKILNMLGELPEVVEPPEIDNVMIDDFLPVVVVNLGGKHSNRALSLMAKEVKISLKTLPGVKDVLITGEFIREFHISLDPDKLRLLGISFEQVVKALQTVNVSVPAGNLKTNSGKYLIKVDEKFHNREAVVRTIIRRDGDGSFIRLEDIINKAEVGYRDPVVISTVNGKDVISLKIIKTSAGNALSIKQNVIHELDKLQTLFDAENLEITLTQDSTVKINDGLSTLGLNMIAGMILVSLIIWYFMGFRNAGIVTVGLPFAFMITMLLMYITGNSLNEMTLFAFVLVSGIIVDDAIVITENIYRHIQEGQEVKKAIVSGVSEVALPVIASTITTIAAFLPMLIMTGSVGDFFAQIPTAVTFALLASLVECLFILPIHYLDYGPRKTKDLSSRLEKDDVVLLTIRTITEKVLRWTLKNRWKSILSVFVMLIVSLGILIVSATGTLALLKIQFFPDDYAIYFVDIKGPSETPLEKIDHKIKEIETIIIKDGPGTAESAAGFAGFYFNAAYEPVYGNNYGTVIVTLPPKDQQSFDDSYSHLEQMRKRLKKQFEKDGITIDVHAQKEGPRTGNDINVRILGTNLTSISALSDELFSFMQNEAEIAPYLIGLNDDRGHPKRIYRFDVHHERVKEFDLDSGEVASLAGSVLDGQYIGKYRLNDEEIDLKLSFETEKIYDLQQALAIPIIEHPVSPIRLGDVTHVRTYQEQGELHRYQGKSSVSLTADLKSGASTSTPAIINKINQYYESIRIHYPGAAVTFGGEQETTQRSFKSLGFAFIIAILIIYIVLAAQFQSYMQPSIILSAVIFALIGVVFGKLFTQSLFTINSFMAIIGVAGVVVNDSLLLIDFMNKSYRKGLSRDKSIAAAVRVRLRPIMLTTITTTLGLLPMALGIPEYSLVWGSMASTFVTGLASATILTLLIVPVLWDLVQERQEKKEKQKAL